MICTIFKNIFDKDPYYITVDKALERIQSGASKDKVEEIRKQMNKERADKLKCNLPSVCFSGKFKERKDGSLIEHSGFIVLDFDDVEELREKQNEIINHDFVKACWVSPRGNGLKALVLIADKSKHREHFNALREVFPEIDRSGANESRVCYESYDPDIYLAEKVKPFTRLKTIQEFEIKQAITESDKVIEKIMKWLVNRGDAFVTGERNSFLFKLASACCRFGVNEQNCLNFCLSQFVSSDNTFSISEAKNVIKSAYNRNKFGTAVFEKDVLVESVTKSEVELENWIDDGGKVKDVIYGEDVKGNALQIYQQGYEKVLGVGAELLDKHFKLKKGEITLLSGIGNYGKSSWLKWFLLLRTVLFGEKFAFFSPEDNPPHEFYHDLVEILLGADCTPRYHFRPSRIIYERAYDFVSKHIFYLYPKNLAPTPEYIKEKFLELSITENTSGNVIDPFNQMHNEYSKSGGRSDKYLETFLADFSRFNQENQMYGIIVAHPHKLMKQTDGNYPCPDVFDIADGAMWNNKMDNIIIYHRPAAQTEPDNPMCEFHSKKIRRQKIVGVKGYFEFELKRPKRRFEILGVDILAEAIKKKGLEFEEKQAEMWKPVATEIDF